MKLLRKSILFIILALFLFSAGNLITPTLANAQFYPVFNYTWSAGLPWSPVAFLPPVAPPVPLLAAPLLAVPSPLVLLRTAAVVTATSPLVTAATPVATIIPPATIIAPSTTPAGFTVTSLVPATAAIPALPLSTTSTYGTLTSLILAGTSPYTLVSLLLL